MIPSPRIAREGIAGLPAFRHNETHAESIATRRSAVSVAGRPAANRTSLTKRSSSGPWPGGFTGSRIVLSRIWAPWRAQYIHEAASSPEPPGGCFLCRGLAGDRDRENFLVFRGPNSVVVLNRYPL